ncbi:MULTISPECIES: type II toxin-antitoxin system RelE/ParE family toxin [unclassified Wolbachia]|uniref:type II toxin-antitoxin system RelE family toxin n=1 Tax=unclassified Wolbachia TaxID=2640676 RepID=UPI002A0A532E|nr:type II toxin-antitoxin system RelE/ParE family toxin [Wolbachia endosymbiont (group A) of Apoderus coryli]
MEYNIIFIESVLEKNLPALPKTIRLRIINAINKRLTIDPINLGEPLYYRFKGQRRLRVGDYRVIYSVNIIKYEVVITEIGHRKDIYK